MEIINETAIEITHSRLLSRPSVTVDVLRLDRLHPVISGNKWFKLKKYLEQADQSGKKTIASFGGAYSNHIIATAAACHLSGFESMGIIRGEKPQQLSPTLEKAMDYGMKLYFISRDDYRQKRIPDAIAAVDPFIIPEGGYGVPGARGIAEIPFYRHHYNIVCCAVGTGTTLAGLINSKTEGQQVLGVSVFKNNNSLCDEVAALLYDPEQPFSLVHDFHFGGYGRHRPELLEFMNDLFRTDGIPTDFVYTGKLFYGVRQLIDSGFFREPCRLLLIHSGGLQGNQSLGKGKLIF
ncbi:pyridoxal-phosphate dependent enzyme [Niabella terrae]